MSSAAAVAKATFCMVSMGTKPVIAVKKFWAYKHCNKLESWDLVISCNSLAEASR